MSYQSVSMAVEIIPHLLGQDPILQRINAQAGEKGYLNQRPRLRQWMV